MNKKKAIEELESTLDNVAHELISTDYFSVEAYHELLSVYYTFRKQFHSIIREDFPNEEFENF
jgi:hypothetical protein